jgi:hypothetical protein
MSYLAEAIQIYQLKQHRIIEDKLLSSNNTDISPQTTQEYTKGKNNQAES